MYFVDEIGSSIGTNLIFVSFSLVNKVVSS